MFHSLTQLLTLADFEKDLAEFCVKFKLNTNANIVLCENFEDNSKTLQIGFRLILLNQGPKSIETEIGWHFLHSVNGSFVKELVNDGVIVDLFTSDCEFEIKNQIQVPRLVGWLLRHNKDFAMIIKRNLPEYVESEHCTSIENIMALMEVFRDQPQVLPVGKPLLDICKSIVRKLGNLDLPADPPLMKIARENIEKIGGFLVQIVCLNDKDVYPIVNECLTTFYQLICDPIQPSAAVTVVLRLVEDKNITKAVNWLVTQPTDDEYIKTAVIRLCSFLRQLNFAPSLNCWIMEIMEGLRTQNKFDLLLNIALSVIDQLTLTLILPFFRQQVAPIVFLVLSSIKHTPVVFNKIIGRIPNIFKLLKKDTSVNAVETLNFLVKIVTSLIFHFGSDNDLYKETLTLLKEWQINCDSVPALNSPPWSYWDYGNNYSNGMLNSTNPRVGLVNLGNTCYMNSVLQALMMTKQFSREVLLSDCSSPLHQKVQQLLALLLHSSRPELTPQDVLQAARPSDFFPGHQQDSSEFLGHLLEMLHEQEKRNLKTSKDSQKIEKWETHFDLAANDQTMDEPMPMADKQNVAADSVTTVTLIQKTFAGRISISNECKECGARNSHFDSFRDLQLSFPDEPIDITNIPVDAESWEPEDHKVDSVQSLLDFYCSTEKLVGDNQYFCDKCKKLCDGERSIAIVEPPNSLILTLKHFRYDQRCHTRAKLMKKVFHDEIVEVIVDGNKVTYQLYAAVIHSGTSLDHGHYYTIATDGRWYKFNDNYVTLSSLAELHSLSPPNTPYILFYQLVSGVQSSVKSMTPEKEVSLCNGDNESTLPQLELEELPSHLREFVQKDNITFKQEVQRLKQKPQFLQSWPVLSKKTYRDSDDDPPPNCGDKAIDCHNRYIC